MQDEQGTEQVTTLQELLQKIIDFRDERDWGQFHSPKNLAMALMVEAAELAEHFQWLTEEQSRQLSGEKKEEIREELGDVFIYLLNLSERMEIDILQAAREKLVKNGEKYPAAQVKGRSLKYDEY